MELNNFMVKNEGNDEGEERNENNSSTQKANSPVTEYGSITSKNQRGIIQVITIIGQIEGHTILPTNTKSTKYEHIIPQLVAIEESSEIEGILVLLNTVGGDVEAGLAISEVIASMKKPCVSLVLGGGHSIGVPLTVSSKKSFIVPSATMTIHPVRYNGLVISAPQTYNYLDKIEDRILEFITRNSKIKRERFLTLMKNVGELATDIGSVLNGEDAVKEGLVDEMGGISDALDALYCLIEKTRDNDKKAEGN